MKNNIYKQLLNLSKNDGLTLVNYEKQSYTKGFQVSIMDCLATKDIEKAYNKVLEMNGNCGIWYSDNVYYIDFSINILELDEAIEKGKENKQLSIYDWKNDTCIFLNKESEEV